MDLFRRSLVAEIPKSGDRWKQANFDLNTFTGFFGAATNADRSVLLFHVQPDGSLGPHEVRPAVSVKSKNYRFELEAASGLAYPDGGRPIGVFARIAARTFLYVLLMPGEPGHAEIEALLDAQEAGGQRMRRIVFDAGTVKAAWPQAPLWASLTL